MRHFDLVIIGTGSGNSILDERFDDWNVAIVEKGVFGGTCLNVGCIPTKMFVHTANVASAPAAGTKLGVDAELHGVRWTEIRDRVFGRIDPIAEGGKRYRAEDCPNVTVFTGQARFVGPKQLDTGTGEVITADRFVIAAGGRPVTPDVPGIVETGFHTNETVMRLDELPKRMIVLGSGFVATEFAHVFSSFGVDVTLVARSGVLLRSEDEEVAARFTELAAQRWDVRLNRETVRAERVDGVVRLHLEGPDGAEVIEADELLVAVGRTPNSDILDVAATGVTTHPDGRVVVDEFQRTVVDGIWALGDISSPFQLKHVANHESRVVQHNLLNPEKPLASDHRFVPHAVFSSPTIASVGLTEQEARAAGVPYVSAVQEYAGIAYGWAMEDTTSFCKLLADPNTGKLLGAHIIGPEAGTLIQPLIQAMHFGLTARTMATGQYWIHPAMPELVENALLKLPTKD
ncbi:mycothione reductase [Allokutzneria oryzae]|uniref:Mycothione reductase n=1 Tax=Allokutzneria oryzae TaxID=1378989 RepID=A0ABV6A4U2_9PSEU